MAATNTASSLSDYFYMIGAKPVRLIDAKARLCALREGIAERLEGLLLCLPEPKSRLLAARVFLLLAVGRLLEATLCANRVAG